MAEEKDKIQNDEDLVQDVIKDLEPESEPSPEPSPQQDEGVKPKEETPLVKKLRTEIEKRNKLIERLNQEKKAYEEILQNEGLDVRKIAEKIEMLELKEYIRETKPELKEKINEIYSLKQKYSNLSPDELVALYYGKLQMSAQEKPVEGHSLAGRQVSTSAGKAPPLEEKTPEELIEIAKQEFRKGG